MRTPAVLRLALAALILHLVLVQPTQPAALTLAALATLPLELPVILLALVAIGPGRWAQGLRAVLVAALTLLAVLKGADFAMVTALSRAFNPVADLALIDAGLNVLTGAMGHALATAAIFGAVLAVGLIAAALWWATGVCSTAAPGRVRGAAALGALAFAGVAVVDIGDRLGRWDPPLKLPGEAFTARFGIERAQMARDTLADLARFNAAAADDPYVGATGLLNLIDRDVIIVFIESYGQTSLDTPLYADLHRQTLAAGEGRLAAAGLAMASGLLASPTRGGQSWLAHASVANGLWIDGQTRYGAVLASGRQTLYHLARTAGFHTAAVMPQITLEWPEASVMGFDTILAAADLGYAGEPFNWVTMPDQFTFAALDRRLREGPREKPLFVQLATGTSHAPWVPVPDLLPWDAIGDGRIYNAIARSGDPPRVVWRDRDRVRAQYRLAIDYALQTVLAYAERHAADPPLMIVMGDHQAASFVALDERPGVPIHVIGPAHLVERTASWGLSPGLLPPADAPVRPMDEVRDLFIKAFTAAPGPS
ncbi:MAG: sulfatase-like hydrolase/transferase [Pseudomonadota bacterium]